MVEVKNLCKSYAGTAAVSDLSFTVDRGQIYGFLGPNGAGKTTVMNIMTGYIGATSGEVIVDGRSIDEEPLEVKKLIGYLPEQPPLYNEMTVYEYLDFVSSIKGVKRDERAAEIERVSELTGIDEVSERLIKNLSKGFRQRVGLAQALIGMPPVIILDEPTVGLDPKQIIEMRELISSLRKDHTVILSSHILSEVSAVCDRVMIISRGRLVACDTPRSLEAMLKGSASVDATVKTSAAKAKEILGKLSGAPEFTVKAGAEKGTCEISVSSNGRDDLRDELFFAFAKSDVAVIEMTASKASLEDVFLELTDAEQEEERE